jgi:hypothetical protein
MRRGRGNWMELTNLLASGKCVEMNGPIEWDGAIFLFLFYFGDVSVGLGCLRKFKKTCTPFMTDGNQTSKF